MTREQVKTIIRLERMINTPSGNPRWLVYFTDGTVMRTAPDSDASIGMQNYLGSTVTVHFDSSGITYVNPV